jgi:uncharacterized protein YdaU (DUF1376 family)
MMLLHEAFVCSTRPNLPDDEEELKLLAYCMNDEEWLSIKDTVLGMFQHEIIDGVKVLTNKRLTKDWDHLLEIREARSEAGKASAAKRKSTNAQQMLTNEHKEVSKEVKISKSSEENDEDADMKLKDELTKIAARYGAKAGGYKTTWDEIKALGIAHGTGAVATDFAAWMEEYQGDDFPAGAVVSYLRVSAERLTANSGPAIIVSKDPRIIDLTRELTYLSDGKVTFQGRHKVALGVLLETYTPEELTEVFKTFIETKDLEDSYTLKFITQNFLDAADGLAYTARKKKSEAETEKSAREATVLRLQKEAKAEREAAQAKEQEETFDPLTDDGCLCNGVGCARCCGPS